MKNYIMKVLLSILLVLFSLVSFSQESPTIPNYQKQFNGYNWPRGYFKDGLTIPAGPTLTIPTYVLPQAGLVRLDTTGADSGFYYYSMGAWQRLARASESGAVDSSNVGPIVKSTTFDNLTALRSSTMFNDGFTLAYLKGFRTPGDGGEGSWFYDAASTSTPDTATVNIPNSLSLEEPGRWHRIIPDNVINLKWWGVRAAVAQSAEYDIARAIERAVQLTKGANSIIYLPADTGGFAGYYYCSRKIWFDRPLTFKGDANFYARYTKLRFPERTSCFEITYKDPSLLVNSVKLEDFYVQQENNSDYGDTTAHAIIARCPVQFENVEVGFAAGNGFHLVGCETPGEDEGSVDFSVLNNCKASGVNHGLYISGCDANKINITKFNGVNCRRWGVWDNGFLGNLYTSPHFNGTAQGQCVVHYGGQDYVAINHDDTVNVGKSPLLRPDLWRAIEDQASTAWDTTVRYWSGGVIYVRDESAWTTIIDPYYECCQPPAWVNTRTISLNGTPGVTTHGGARIRSILGLLVLQDQRVVNPDGLAVGPSAEEVLNSTLNVINIAGQTYTTHFESTGVGLYSRYKNSDNANGVLNYYGAIWRLGGTGGYQWSSDLTGFYPGDHRDLGPSDDSLHRLGAPDDRWKDAYFANTHTSTLEFVYPPSSNNAADSMLVWNPTTKIVGKRPVPTGGSGDLLAANNLSDVANATTARANLGLVIGTDVLAPNGSAANLTSFPTLNQNTTGSAASLTTARNINGTAFNGTSDITVTAAAGTLTGATLASGVTASSLTSFGSSPTIATPNITTGFKIGGAAASGKIPIGDGTNYVASTPTYPNAASTSGNVITSDGTNFVSSANTGGWTTLRVSGSNATTTGQALVDITGLVTGTLSNATLYEVEAVLYVTTSAVTTGTQYAITANGSGGASEVFAIVTGTTTTNATTSVTQSASGAQQGTFLTTASASGIITIKGFVLTRGSGTATIALQHLKITSGTSTVKIGSVFRYRLAQ